jgi:RNA polymerase-binding transcription factor DksA
MPDETDRLQELRDFENASIIESARAEIPKGEPGECAECGEESLRLVGGRCAPCRDSWRKP